MNSTYQKCCQKKITCCSHHVFAHMIKSYMVTCGSNVYKPFGRKFGNLMMVLLSQLKYALCDFGGININVSLICTMFAIVHDLNLMGVFSVTCSSKNKQASKC